jgi:hypothetical protein
VSNGGGLIGTVLTGTQDQDYRSTGNMVLGDVFGIELKGKYSYDHSFIDLKEESLKKDVLDMAQQVYGECALISVDSARVLADLWEPLLMKDGRFIHLSSPPGRDTGHPAITLNQYGKGKAAFMSNDIFYAYAHRSQWNLKNLFENLVTMVDPEKLLLMDAPGNVEVVLTRKFGITQVHLVNHYREKALGRAITIAEHVLPVNDIGIRVRINAVPLSVIQQPEGDKLEWNYQDGYVSFRVPKLEIYSIIEIR